MPSKKPGHEVGRESALVAFGGKALLPFLDGTMVRESQSISSVTMERSSSLTFQGISGSSSSAGISQMWEAAPFMNT